MPKHPIYIIVLILIISVFIALPLVKVPISVSARGVVRSAFEDTQITASAVGRVVQNHITHNNQAVQKGDTLLVITTEILDTQRQLLDVQITDFEAQLADLSLITAGNSRNLQTRQVQQEFFAFREKLAQLQAQLSLAQKELDRGNILFEKGVIARADHEKIFYRHEELQRQLRNAQEEQTAHWQTQRVETERKIQTLLSERQRLGQEQKNYVLTAPISGRIVNYNGIRSGGFVASGQLIASISSQQNLIAECMVSPKDIGFVRPEQNVRFQIDTYNYNQWGLLDGFVSDIDQNIQINEQTGEGLFKVRCLMEKSHLQLKNGYQGIISKGMTLTARFHLTDRTLWQLLFDRADDWFNPNLK
ncbi:MAG: HlyD family efflux transporter periplasmic adaptor subunit [Capnocytophaga sp.]|nr:HlyD family efflux transporter periplasmic adaptor subunit [Capnocytophaga sp.]